MLHRGEGTSPFGALGRGAPAVTTGPLNPLQQRSPYQLPPTGEVGTLAGIFRPTEARVRSENLAAFKALVLQRTQQGMDFGSAVDNALDTEIGDAAISDPDFPKNAQDFLEFLKPEPPPKPIVVGAESRLATEEGKVLLDVNRAAPEPSSAEKLTAAIIKAEGKGPAGKREAELLLKHLPREADGTVTVKEYAVLVAAGVTVSNPPKGLEGLSQKEATMVVALLNPSASDRALTEYEMILIGLGAVKNSNITARAAEAAVRAKAKLRQQKRKSDFAELLAITGKSDMIGELDLGGGEEDIDDLFKKFRAEGAEAGEAKAARVVAKDASPAPSTPSAGAATAKVGGKAGQAKGPQLPIDPAVIETAQELKPEEFAALDLEALATISAALVEGQLKLSPEQRRALLDALTAANAEAGGGGGGSQ